MPLWQELAPRGGGAMPSVSVLPHEISPLDQFRIEVISTGFVRVC